MKPYRRQLLGLLTQRTQPVRRGAEIGVARGETSATLLRHLTDLHLILVDAWATYAPEAEYHQSGDSAARQSAAEQEAAYQAALSATAFAADRRHILRAPSVTAAQEVPSESLDFVFIDGDHTHAGVTADIAAWFPKLAPDGLLCGHDYGHPRDRRGQWGVTRAVHAFADHHHITVQTGPGTLWWIDFATLSFSSDDVCFVSWHDVNIGN